MDQITVDIARIATGHDGIVTSAQLNELGVDDSKVKRLAKAGFLHRQRRGVYFVGHRAVSRAARWRAATVAHGSDAVLAGRAAAQHWGIDRNRSDRIDVIVPSKRRPMSGVHVHRTRLADEDRTTHRGLDVTSVARTLYDLARTGVAVDELTFMFHEAAYLELLDLHDVERVLARNEGRRGVVTLRAATAAHRAGERGTRSSFERRVASYLARCGIARPHMGAPLHLDGEVIEVDLWWPEHRLVVEVDGPGHGRPAVRARDREVDRLLRRAGIEVIRISHAAFANHPARAVQPVLAAFGIAR
jgi:hypothetical protein